MEEDGVKLKTSGGQSTGGVSGLVGFGIGDDGVQKNDGFGSGDNGLGIGGLSGGQSMHGRRGDQNWQSVQDGQKKQEEQDGQIQEIGQRVVSLKGVYTESEMKRQQKLEEMKKKAVALGKTEAEIKKEKKLEEIKREAVSLKDGQQLSVGSSQSMISYTAKASRGRHNSQHPSFKKGWTEEGSESAPNPSFVSLRQDYDGHASEGSQRKSTPNHSFKKGRELGRVRTVITSEGRLVKLKKEKLADKQGVVDLKEENQNKEISLDTQKSKKDLKHVVDLGSAKSTSNPSQASEGNKGKSTSNPLLVHGSQFMVHGKLDKIDEKKKDNLERWEEQKVDLSELSSEQRINLQATPSLASVHWRMEDDLNGEVATWFDKYNKLPVNIKLGLSDTQVVQRAVKELAEKFGIITEEGLGEISRIVRDVYVNLIGKLEIKKRAMNNLKIVNDRVDDFLEGIVRIVILVQEVGNKKTDEYFEKLSVAEILEKYPKIAEQDVTVGDIFDKKQQRNVAPTLKNWIDDYVNNAGSDKHTSLERGKYLEESHNTKNLDDDDRQAVAMLTKSYDTGLKLLVDSKEGIIYWGLHTDESELGINSDKSKRIINNFKIEEAQRVDVDHNIENYLEDSVKSDIMKEKTDKFKNNQNIEDGVLDLSKG